MGRFKVTIKFSGGLCVTISHDCLFAEVNVRNDYFSGYISENDMMMGRERHTASRNQVSVRIGIAGESRSMIEVEDATVSYTSSGKPPKSTVHVTKGVITGWSIPDAFGTKFDEIIFGESHEESAP